MLKTRFGLSRKPFLIKRNVANTNVLGVTQLSPSDDNIFKKRQPIRDSPFSGRIYDTLMKEFDADAAFDSRVSFLSATQTVWVKPTFRYQVIMCRKILKLNK